MSQSHKVKTVLSKTVALFQNTSINDDTGHLEVKKSYTKLALNL